MSASPSDLLAVAASTSSSGLADGLGRRTLDFDREEGAMLERLTVRPELAAFVTSLRDRLDRISALEDERIARPLTIEHDGDGSLAVVSEFVPGCRLADLLDIAADQGASPGVDAAFGYLLDVLPALCGLHAGAGFFHGAIAPSRTVMTPAGQVVLLDAIYGDALAHLRYSRRKLWSEFGIVTSDTAGTPRLDVQADIAQVVLSAVMLVLGRPLYADEYPDALPRVLLEVGEVAQIRGSAGFATGFQVFLHRALPVPNRQPYASADDALIDLRDLASELGVHVCRRALVDFIEQMDPGRANTPVPEEAATPAPPATANPPAHSMFIALPAEFELVDDEADLDESADEDLDVEAGAELDLESLVEGDESPYDFAEATEVEVASEPAHDPLAWDEPAGYGSTPQDAAPIEPGAWSAVGPPDDEGAPLQPSEEPHAPSVRSRRAKRTRSARARKDKLRSAATPAPLLTQRQETPKPFADAVEPAPAIDVARAPEPDIETEPEPEPEPKPSQAAEPLPKPADNWLVKPGRADAFEAPTDEPPSIAPAPLAERPPIAVASPFAAAPPMDQGQSTAPPAPFAPPMAPPASSFTAPPLPQYPTLATPPPPAPMNQAPPYTPQPWTPAPAAAAPPPPPVAPPITVAGPAPLKLKEPAVKPRAARPAPPAADIWATPAPPSPETQTPTAFPWKLAVGALAAMAVLIVGGRAYLPGRSAGQPEQAATEAVASPVTAARESSAPRTTSAAASPAAATGASTTTGRLEIETQPAGAKIVIDGKPAGESPLVVESLPAGRHSVTLTTASGSVKRSIRIEAGRTVKLDVPIFSGWVGIFAPFVVEVSEGGRVIGTTEESRLMLSPGRHELTLVNRELGYSSVQSVEIEPGETRSIPLDPRGTVNLNATPWAEVWVDGKKAGDTPLAGLQLPLGVQEIAFRHPQFGERRVTVSVKGNAPVALSVDMTKR